LPEVVTLIDCAVEPVDQRYMKPAGALSVTEPPSQNVVGPDGVIVGVAGAGVTVTAVAAEVVLQPVAFVTVTLYEPAVLTLIDCVVAPVDQRYDDAAFAVSVTEPPSQKVVGPDGVIVAVGNELTVTTAEPWALPPQYASELAVTVYVVVEDGDTTRVAGEAVMPFCTKPSDQVRFHGAVPVSAAEMVAEPPAQTAVVPLTVTCGRGLLVSTSGSEVLEQPAAFVIVTQYVPGWVTLMLGVVAPVDQRWVHPVDCPEESVTVTPSQKGLPPVTVIVGFAMAITETVWSADSFEQPFASTTVTR
jgi:hypothetical protein